MHINLVIGACIAGLQLASANVPQDRKQHNIKTKWVTEIKTVKGHPPRPTSSHWAGGWGPQDGKTKHPHEGTNDSNKPRKHDRKPHKVSKSHDNDGDDKPKKHRKITKGPKGSGDDVNFKQLKKQHKGFKGHDNDNRPKHHKNKGTGKHQKDDNDKPHKPNHDKPNSSKGRTKGSTPKNDGGNNKNVIPEEYQSEVIQCHNIHRANHSSPDIGWSDSLAATAAKIAKGCVFQHVMGEDGGGYGQNIAAGVAAAGISHIISDQFYNSEINDFGNQYGDAHPTGFESWGHFSQLVWKNTDQVGCATQYCPNGVGNTGAHVPPYFTVCNYHPPGNVAGQYGTNIGRPLGRPTVRGHGPNDDK